MPDDVKWTTFGDAIRSGRVAQGFSMRALAAAASISAPYVNELEKGRSRAGLDVVGRLCEALQIPFVETAALLGYRLPTSTIDVAMSQSIAIDAHVTPEEALLLQDHLRLLRSRPD
jgi:transcriptional regulator with XRE-family HTH domain